MDLYKKLEQDIIQAYQSGVTLGEAEKLATKFLHAMMRVSEELTVADLDSRMRKTGIKAIKARLHLDACAKAEKKPTESQLEHLLNSDTIVQSEQDDFDNSEANRDNLERYFQVFREAHVHFRGIAKGKYE